MKRYFDHCTTIEEAKKLQKELAKQYHPDKGGNDEIMKEINSRYDEFLDNYEKNTQNVFKDFFSNQDSFTGFLTGLLSDISKFRIVEKDGGMYIITTDPELMDKLRKLNNFKGLLNAFFIR